MPLACEITYQMGKNGSPKNNTCVFSANFRNPFMRIISITQLRELTFFFSCPLVEGWLYNGEGGGIARPSLSES